MTIHPTAIVHPGAELGADVDVQAYTIIGPHVRVGRGTSIGPHCVIDGRTLIGEANRIFSGAQIGVLSQDLKHRHDLVGRCVIGNRNIFREHASVSASTMASDADEHRVTSIGDDCMFMSCSHVAHDCHVGDHVILANCALLAGHVDVEDRAILGGLAGVHQETKVGTMAFIGGMSRISKDAPPFMIAEGNPPRIAGPNVVGLTRSGMEEPARRRVKLMYKIMWRSGLNTKQALDEIEKSVEPSIEREIFVEFVQHSIRGIIK